MLFIEKKETDKLCLPTLVPFLKNLTENEWMHFLFFTMSSFCSIPFFFHLISNQRACEPLQACSPGKKYIELAQCWNALIRCVQEITFDKELEDKKGSDY